jgi:hypothetical protein
LSSPWVTVGERFTPLRDRVGVARW